MRLIPFLAQQMLEQRAGECSQLVVFGVTKKACVGCYSRSHAWIKHEEIIRS